ncbi:DUF5722 domain-containing protein [Neorhodopirellula lusitana]|uniref:DUF5722 domain-containing protein n=1 Tax=Neorhodopirellula lusitana TaxID=445327 RepID=UPI0038500832
MIAFRLTRCGRWSVMWAVMWACCIGLVFAATSRSDAAAMVAVPVTGFDEASTGVVRHAAGDVVEITGDVALRLTPKSKLSGGQWTLEMDCFCLGGLTQFEATIGPGYDATSRFKLPLIPHTEVFSPYQARLAIGDNWIDGASDLRLDLKLAGGGSLQIKNVRLRLVTTHDSTLSTRELSNLASTTAADSEIVEYLDRKMPATITEVVVGERQVSIRGVVSGYAFAGEARDEFVLAEIAMETLLSNPHAQRFQTPVEPAADGTFKVVLPRIDDRGFDRITSRWQLEQVHHVDSASNVSSGSKQTIISHTRYADEVFCRNPDLPPAAPKTKKGLGGWRWPSPPEVRNDLDDLGIQAVTVNLNALHRFVSTQRRPGWSAFQWQGKTYYANDALLARYDQTFLAAQNQNVMVSVILLVTNPADGHSLDAKLLASPDADSSGTYAMPDVTSSEGLNYYGAILNLMAQRWSRSQGQHGRVHHWIVHNEVDFGYVWTNAGNKTARQYMSLYHRSLRLVDLIVRQYDPNARAFISLTHHWAKPGAARAYGSRRMLEMLAQYCDVEGDFPWAVAHHPYPQSLRNPRTWEDHQATSSVDTDKITPWNLEVLDAYMKRPEMRFRGQVRKVHLSENGFNSPDYSRQSLTDQAAGMAIAWAKIQPLSSIEMWHYHNWIDNRNEGGLRIGLRKFFDDVQAPYAKKPIWHLYQTLGTPGEQAAVTSYLQTIDSRQKDLHD